MITCTKRGTLNKIIYEATCKHCGSEFECKKSDLEIINSRNEMCIQTQYCDECGKYGISFKPSTRKDK